MSDEYRLTNFGLLGQRPQPGDTSHLKAREFEVQQVPGGFIVRISGGGVRYHRRVVATVDGLTELLRAHMAGTLTEPAEGQ